MSKKSEAANMSVVPHQDDLAGRSIAIREEAERAAAQMKELGIDVTDLVIPLVQLMQNTSEFVSDEKAKLGDIVNMQTGEVLGGLSTSVKILPLKMFKTLRVYDVTNSGFKFLREEPLSPANEKMQGEGNEDGVLVKRYHTLNFFVLVKQDLDKDEGFPCLIRFRSTGMNAGRALATHLYKLVHLRKLPYSKFVELSCKKEKKDTATYAAFQIGASSPANDVEMKAAEQWLATLATVSYRVDEKEEMGEANSHGPAAAKPVVVEGTIIGDANGAY